MKSKLIQVNRAPVMTLWAAVVAERRGIDPDMALTLGKAVAGLNAQSKGKRLGIYEPKDPSEKPKRKKTVHERVEICGRTVPTVKTKDGVRAVAGDQTIEPKSVRGYLQRSFGDQLDDVRSALAALAALAAKFEPDALELAAYGLYERFRPNVPAGKTGWGSKGELDPERIRELKP